MAALTLALALTVYAIDGSGGPPEPPVPDPEQAEPVAEVQDAPTPPEPAYGVWDRLASCESGQNWSANTGNGYRGGLQMDAAFWRNHGGLAYASRPDWATRAQQIQVAINGRDGLIGGAQGWAAWPYCSRHLGLR